MKEGWVTKKLGEVLELLYGKALPESDRKLDGKYPAFGANGEIARTDRALHQCPSIIIGRKGSAGALLLYHHPFWATDVTYYTKFDVKKYDLGFLHYLLISLNLSQFARGVKPGINREQVYSLEISHPPLLEQQRIVAILDTAFADLAQAKSNAKKNLANAKELFEADLNVTITEARNSWDGKTLGTCAKFIDYRGKTPKKTSEGLRLITAKNVKKGYLQREPQEYVSPSTYATWMTRGIPRKDDVLFTTEAPLANVAQLDTDDCVVFAQRIIILQGVHQIIDNTFLKYALLSQPLQAEIYRHGTGATATGIKSKLLKTISIPLPPLTVQHRIAARLDKLSEHCKKLEAIYTQKLSLYDEMKQSLLQKAFSGQL